jgi:hypothetical protein
MTDRPRWWLVVVAALTAAIFLYQSIGLGGAMLLVAGSVAAMVVYRFFRSRKRGDPSGVRCLTCGETLPATARQCKYCGSARWTVN